MTVVDRDKIDITYIEDNKVILCISDHLDWEQKNLETHWKILVDKIKAYMAFIESGQFSKMYQDKDLKPCIKIYFSYKWPSIVDKYLNKLKDIHQDYGCEIIWVYDER